MEYYKNFLPLILLLGLSGDVTAVINVDGILGGSVLLNVNVVLPANTFIQWITNNAIVAQQFPSSSPQCLNQLVGKCELYQNGSLRIDNVTYTDGGNYILSALISGSSTTNRTEYKLNVYGKLSASVLSSNDTKFPLISGTYVTLHCDAGNQTVTTYTFYRDQKTICTEPHVICRGSFLDFRPITEKDSGIYTCSIQNPVSTNTSNSLNVTVMVPVSNIKVTINTSALVWPNRDSVSLRCSALGTDVSYSWRLQGVTISGGGRFHLTDNNATLIISPVSTNDNGSFICTAKNSINSINSTELKLDLASPVSSVALTSNTSGVVWAGEDSVSLYCSAQGSAVTFSWSLNGKPVPPNPPYYITQSDSPPNSNLTIRPVSKNDTGPFTCTATNLANSETSNATSFNINWFPDGDINCTVQAIDKEVELGCLWPGGRPAANVTMTFNNVQDTATNEVFRNVTISNNIHGSNLTCNGRQLGKTSNCVVRFEPPKYPGFKNNETTEVKEGGTVILTVDLLAGNQSRASSPSFQVLPAEFSWSHGAGPIPNNDKFKVNSSNYASTLTIHKVSTSESGTYECTATNLIGKTTFVFNMDVSNIVVPSNGLDGGEIAGIVIGVLAGVTIIGIIVFFVLKKQKRASKNGRLNEADDQIGTIEYAEIKKDNNTNGGMALTGISNNLQDHKDDVNYAQIKFPNKPSTKNTTLTPPPPEETVYSDVKNSTKT
ncbi:cell adhesion molecule CEACAM5-like [Rhinoderma darwinii]|uniref:cell adhesion molecule CEACAM5-like n=1 Tax=Rhinoderma darwinii TaxID=43563 RepID=UPI003F6698D3